jgi:hypothetical protein
MQQDFKPDRTSLEEITDAHRSDLHELSNLLVVYNTWEVWVEFVEILRIPLQTDGHPPHLRQNQRRIELDSESPKNPEGQLNHQPKV